MPIRKDWIELNAENVKTAPGSDGVIELGDGQEAIIYIAGTPNLRQTLEEHLNPQDDCLKVARYFRYEETFMYTMRESELLQQFMRQNKRMPRCNEEII